MVTMTSFCISSVMAGGVAGAAVGSASAPSISSAMSLGFMVVLRAIDSIPFVRLDRAGAGKFPLVRAASG